jgi:hypothetical protein
MMRSAFSMMVGVAMLTAMGLGPLTHLHVATGEHRHAGDGTHVHQSQVHAHLEGHHTADRAPRAVSGVDVGRREHGRIVSLDTMRTELTGGMRMLPLVESTPVLPQPRRAAAGDRSSEPRAHGPPIVESVLGRAPPA